MFFLWVLSLPPLFLFFFLFLLFLAETGQRFALNARTVRNAASFPLQMNGSLDQLSTALVSASPPTTIMRYDQFPIHIIHPIRYISLFDLLFLFSLI